MTISAKEFQRRRRQLARIMGSGAMAVIPAAPEKVRSRDTHYRYRQDSDFHYLTNFPEAEAVAVIMPGRPEGEFVLFCRPEDKTRTLWDGANVGLKDAKKCFGADEAFSINDIDHLLPELLSSCDCVYYSMGVYPEFDQRILGWMAQTRSDRQKTRGSNKLEEIVALDFVLHDMRLYKSRSEIAQMRRAANIAVKTHERAMRFCQPGVSERAIVAEIEQEFFRQGGEPAYLSIVAAGNNACTLHYVDYHDTVNEGDLVLIDAGCELDYYCSDVTRTFPANGCFTPEQRAIYELVLKSQYAAIEEVREGNAYDAPHNAAVKVITKGLLKLGLLKGTLAKNIHDESYKAFFPHKTGHWLGIDVHDVGDYKVDEEWRELEPSMVLTIEPGIYIAPGNKKIPKKWWGIGVRIEDDVLVTDDDPLVLSGKLIKEPDDIEAFMQQSH
ncbi:MAG: M24 family metallopeptidase [Gammaproteobacteria bacterium]|nr:M24 family metallopeptidase [Gammaproteobacteria bacterium]